MPNRIQWATGSVAKPIEVTTQNSWGWPQIQHLLDEVLLSDRLETTDSLDSSIQKLYGFLPEGKQKLRRLKNNAKRYYRMGGIGGSAREEVAPYRKRLKALVWAVRIKLSAVLTAPNPHKWHKRAYGFYLALQHNLGTNRRLHFLTITFPDNPTYGEVRRRFRGITKNLLYRKGFESVDVVAFHPRPGKTPRIHAHLLVWSREQRSYHAEKVARGRVKIALHEGRYGVGFVQLSEVRDFLKTAAYMAWNYDTSLRLNKGDNNPLPKGARLASAPKEVHPGQKWKRTGKFSFHTPQMQAWRAAVGRYAAATGKTTEGNWQWIWRERHRIYAHLRPEEWHRASVTGLDGYTYRVIPYDEDIMGHETYLLDNDKRGGFILTEHGLAELGRYDAASGALRKNDLHDLTTGEHACWYEVWGLPLPDWRIKKCSLWRRRHSNQPIGLTLP